MKKNEKKELLDKTDEVLKELLGQKQKHLFDLRSQAVTEKLENPTLLGKAKRDIALIKTVLRQRELAASK
jgi:large subunit ribosomal protein L29